MKRRFVCVLLCVAAAIPFMVAAPAQADDAMIEFTDVGWTTSCDTGMGQATYTISIFAPEGYRAVHTWSWGDDPIWGSGSNRAEFVLGSTWNLNQSYYWLIGTPGWQDEVWELYAPSGLLVSRAYFYASCATGEITILGGNIYDPLPPAASERVDGVVVDNTAVYGSAGPEMLVDGAVLMVGQTWFVVDEATGTDGASWYKVYVSGGYGWVPSNVIALSGPIP